MVRKRLEDIRRFYYILHNLEKRVGGKRKLKSSSGRMNWPRRGVYFFFEDGENRRSGEGLRITRVGTHAVSEGSGTTLWDRLRMHRGTLGGRHPGGGNHRGSIFRLRVGEAIIARDGLHDEFPNWGKGSSASRGVREREYPLERMVSEYIGNLPFLWLRVDDESGPTSVRAYLERNSIALLSNYGKTSIDPRDDSWLGNYSPRRDVRQSGLWNSDYVTERYDLRFLGVLEKYVNDM